MLNTLDVKGIGPAPSMHLEFGNRLNIITGDNGLGKSFILDIAFWAVTRRWPVEINPALIAGSMARPRLNPRNAEISFSFTGKTRPVAYTSKFDPETQSWTGSSGRPANPGLVIYAMADGSFAIWDPARNYWITRNNIDIQDRVPAYVMSPKEVWDGLSGKGGNRLCKGLIDDLVNWQLEGKDRWNFFCKCLKVLSSSSEESMHMGELTKVSLDDARDIPTIVTSFGLEIPITQASSGVRRILAIAYLLIWSWYEHKAASILKGDAPADQMIILVDEIESHLHPKWQFSIMGSLLDVVNQLAGSIPVQIIAVTHSPQILTSLEPLFDPDKDAWFDIDLINENGQQSVELLRKDFEPHGTSGNWLTSDAFDLPSDRAPKYKDLMDRASLILESNQPELHQVRNVYKELLQALNPKDSFLFRWRAQAERKGLKLWD